MAPTKTEGTARERLLAAANDLFYAEGIHTVGIDRIIERAGVAKASLYGAFGSKEELVCAYLARRSASRREIVAERLARHDSPRDRILAVFDVLAELVTESSYRGCAFANASAEGPLENNRVRQVCADHRAWLRGLFTTLAGEMGLAEPRQVGGRLALLYDGAAVGASMDRNPGGVADARAMAEAVLDAPASSAKRTNGKPPIATRRKSVA
jgi:AcrR family transcriptional regulator